MISDANMKAIEAAGGDSHTYTAQVAHVLLLSLNSRYLLGGSVPTSDFLTERGLEYARERGLPLGASIVDQCDPGYQELFANFVQNGMYTRDVFTQPTRELVAVACLTALYRTEELRRHVAYALRLSPVEEVREAILQAGVYSGFPCAMNGLAVLAEVLKEGDGAA
jgi:4-carboxymuconolactone decarboxylase